MRSEPVQRKKPQASFDSQEDLFFFQEPSSGTHTLNVKK